MEIFVLIALILLNGVFAMSEIALVTARRARLARLAEDGDGGATLAIRLGEEPTRFLSTIQIGITSIGILNGIVGEAALAAPLATWLQTLGLEQRGSEIGATALVVIVITYVSIVIGELVPKRIAQINPEGIARLVSRPMNALAIASRPFVHLLSWSTTFLLRILGKRDEASPSVTEEEIHAMLEEGSVAGIIEKSEHEMVRNVFRLDDRLIGSLMVPRADIVWLDVNRPLDENLVRMAESEHSRFPVCRGGLEEVLGIVTSKQLFNQTLKGGTPTLTRNLQPAVYVPESLTGMELLDQFRASSTHMVFVIDEYGEVLGMVTLYDVLESVTGEFHPHGLDEAWAVQREDGSWLLDGLIPILELKDRLGLKNVPEEEKGRYHTLSGMLMWLLGRLAQTGDIVTWEQWRLEVIDLDGKRIDKVLATRAPEPPPTNGAETDVDRPEG
ncbi:MAG: HlyC/CorC family transporter [Thauera phenolivorans]|uniref:HlyC/CorC family transporter n=1 Tax=Thauera phenolivorans TaxID=1792543 RepID=A0A7X7R6X4_9RHOO|nr:hemolysin family protein [Thauera phenolivorans]NLF53560.1 HlyC/CorC family transporter [Thauera phenolivorans]